MQNVDWIVLIGTLLFIVTYGAYKTRGSKTRNCGQGLQQRKGGKIT